MIERRRRKAKKQMDDMIWIAGPKIYEYVRSLLQYYRIIQDPGLGFLHVNPGQSLRRIKYYKSTYTQ